MYLQDETDEAILDETNVNLIAQEDDAALLTPTTITAPLSLKYFEHLIFFVAHLLNLVSILF